VSDWVISQIRTIVPVVAGWIAAQALAAGFELDRASLESVLTVVATLAYYTAARALERRWPRLGWLLGYPKPPSYGV
jgi:hypothetical protein